MDTLYLESRKYDLLSFWNLVCKDKSIRELMLKLSSEKPSSSGRRESDAAASSSSSLPGWHQLKSLKEKAHDELDSAAVCHSSSYTKKDVPTAEEDLFAVGARLGTRDLPGQRVQQIATIVRNLSFEEDNAAILGKNEGLLRFCLLCCSSDWSNLNQMGFDILSNIASEVVLQQADESCVTDVILSIVTKGISSADRFQVVVTFGGRTNGPRD